MDFDLIVIAGEPSGDEHAALFLKELKKSNPDLKIAAVSGPEMDKAYKHQKILDISKFSIMGFIDVLINLPKLFFLYRKLLKFLLNNPSKAILFVDYPGMNLKLQKDLKKQGYKGKLFQFIAPTAWAWKKNRVFSLKENCDHLFCILPFEESFFKSYGVKASYVGNPLVEKLACKKTSLKKDPKLLAIFPGSRKHEIEKNLTKILEAVKDLQNELTSFHLGISIANPHFEKLIKDTVALSSISYPVTYYPKEKSLELMQKASFAIAKSGTCNLELALLGTPSIIVYHVRALDQWIALKLFKIKLKFFSLPNLILDQALFAELYGSNFTKENLKKEILDVFQNQQTFKKGQEKLLMILGNKNPGQEIVQTLKDLV
jgi:lipid-A-disaccharide synthase